VSCPATMSLVRAALTTPEQLAQAIGPLSDEQVADVYSRAKPMLEVLKALIAQIYARATHQPIPLGDGLVLGPVETTRESVDGAKARLVLTTLYGPEVADASCEVSTSKAAIERALKPLAVERGAKYAPLEREAMGALRAAGAVETKTTIAVKEVRTGGDQ
jgi:hypothetical protein